MVANIGDATHLHWLWKRCRQGEKDGKMPSHSTLTVMEAALAEKAGE